MSFRQGLAPALILLSAHFVCPDIFLSRHKAPIPMRHITATRTHDR